MNIGPAGVNPTDIILHYDAASFRSTLQSMQASNILPNPGNWTAGTGGQTGYSSNGSSSEQSRAERANDPWGRQSMTWRTTPDSTSGADGGWNTSYYTVDPAYTYRWSVWAKRYTSGTGGTFYMGLNLSGGGNPLRNDNNSAQSNPYYTYTSISNMTQDKWYLVVGHVFHENYSAGARHPDSGWYEDGVKISDKSNGNVGAYDLRFPTGTTSARHRTYHYYTTNTSSGLEFCWPRLDKLDGTEPSIDQLIKLGESEWKNIVGDHAGSNMNNGITFSGYDKQSVFTFDGTDDHVVLGNIGGYSTDITVEAVVKKSWDTSGGQMIIAGASTGDFQLKVVGGVVEFGGRNDSPISQDAVTSTFEPDAGAYYHIIATYDSTTAKMYINGSEEDSVNNSSGGFNPSDLCIGAKGDATGGFYNGDIAFVRVYKTALNQAQVTANYRAMKNRFGI